MANTRENNPGDAILDRHLRDASPEMRAEARENLRLLAELAADVWARLALDNPHPGIRADAAAAVDSESPLPNL